MFSPLKLKASIQVALLGVAAACSMQAQPATGRSVPPAFYRDGLVGFGVIAGGELRDWFSTGQTGSTAFSDNTGRFMIGPTVQFHIGRKVVLEADAMRRGFGARNAGSVLGVGFSESSSGSSWEFPVLLKRRFLMSQYVKPYLGAGVAFRYLSADSTLTSANNDPKNNSTTSDHSTSIGIPFVGGLEFRTGILRISPELRYTLWTSDRVLAAVRTSGAYNSNINQVGFLVSFTVN